MGGTVAAGQSQGLSLLTAANEEEALRILRAGQLAREVAEHQFNHASSRRVIGKGRRRERMSERN